MSEQVNFDWQRHARTGIAEAVLCSHKSYLQVAGIVAQAQEKKQSLLLTRLADETADRLLNENQKSKKFNIDWHPVSSTAFIDNGIAPPISSDCLIITAGTSDVPVAEEARRTLLFNGISVDILHDCGVAGLWRLTDQLAVLSKAPVIIAVAGMEGALFSVLAGLVPALVIAVPGSTGYGVSEGGQVALSSALSSCAPGVVVVNIDNGFGAACAMLKILSQSRRGIADVST